MLPLNSTFSLVSPYICKLRRALPTQTGSWRSRGQCLAWCLVHCRCSLHVFSLPFSPLASTLGLGLVSSFTLNLTDLWVEKERKEQLWCLWRKVGESGLHEVVQRAPAACAQQAGHTHLVSWSCPGSAAWCPSLQVWGCLTSCDSLSLPCLGKMLARCVFSHDCFYYEALLCELQT